MPQTEPQIEWRIPLGRKISAVIFLCILVVEAAILGFSYFNERDRHIAQIDRSIDLLMPAMSELYSHGKPEQAIARVFAASHYPVVGLVLHDANGQKFETGYTQGLPELNNYLLHSEKEAHYYDRKVELTGTKSVADAMLTLRFNVDSIQEELNAYIVRIFLLTLIISFFVIVGSLLALRPFLFQPISILGGLMRRVDEQGLADIDIPPEMLRKGDEIGDTFRAFDRMRSALMAVEEENRAITTRFQTFAELAADCFYETDATRRFRFVAGDTESVFGLSPGQILGKTFTDLVSQGGLPFSKPKEVAETLIRDGSWEGQLVATNQAKEGRTVKMVCKDLFDADGNRAGMRGILTDTTLAAKLTRELVHRAAHDGLTGLYNRTEFSRRLSESLVRIQDHGGRACVFVMDLDRFKLINDRCGHLAGDEVLKQVSEILLSSVRQTDIVARMGGDEFATLLERCPVDVALQIAERIRTAVDRLRFDWNGERYSLGVSIGVVEVDRSYVNDDEVIRAADSSCFTAKRHGRNQVSVYSPSDNTVKERAEDLRWTTLIEQALSEDRYVLYQQPIMSLKNFSPGAVHFEVLLRLLDEHGDVIPPGAFLPTAERNGFIDAIDRRVVNKVVAWLEAQGADESMELTVAVNLSGASIADVGFQEFLLETISSANIFGGHLCFEITESAAVRSLGSTADFLTRIQALGCRIALDDFGTGFASLEYIKQLPLDFIKIDGAFIKDIASNPLDQALVRCVADVARLLDVATVAEFVENDETIRELNKLGIDYAQGYLISKPRELGDLASLFPSSEPDDGVCVYE